MRSSKIPAGLRARADAFRRGLQTTLKTLDDILNSPSTEIEMRTALAVSRTRVRHRLSSPEATPEEKVRLTAQHNLKARELGRRFGADAKPFILPYPRGLVVDGMRY